MIINKNEIYTSAESEEKEKLFINTGIKRIPKKGEWFLSGAVVEAYMAYNDMSARYYIAKEIQITNIDLVNIEFC